MSTINDGGFAFPSPEWSDAHGNISPQEYGMSLRDYFAAKAMQGFAADPNAVWKNGAGGMARCAYEWADAMLKASEQKGGEA